MEAILRAVDLAGLDVKSKMLRERSEGGRVEVIVEAPSSLMDAKSQRLYEKPYSVFNFGSNSVARAESVNPSSKVTSTFTKIGSCW